MVHNSGQNSLNQGVIPELIISFKLSVGSNYKVLFVIHLHFLCLDTFFDMLKINSVRYLIRVYFK